MLKQIKLLEDELLNSFPLPEDQLTQKEVAALFGKSVQTIIKWKKKKIIPYYLVGINPIFSKKEMFLVASRNRHLLRS